jgi:hypothetical protein
MFCLHLESTEEKNRIQIRNLVYGSKDPDLHKNTTIWNTDKNFKMHADADHHLSGY